MPNTLAALSEDLAGAAEQAGRSVVAVHARPRLASSGVHWRPGVIVTADHTLRQEEEIGLTLPDGGKATAVLAGRDPATDLAVLKLESAAFPVAASAPEESARPGNIVLAIGRCADTGVTATLGLISSAGGPWRTWRGGLIDRFLRLDTSLYPGGSGGPVVDTLGRVLGIGTSGLSRISAIAVPAATVNRVIEELLVRGSVRRGYLGVGLHPVPLPDHLQKQWNIPDDGGLIVLSVEPDSPAARAGLLIGDILLALGERPVRDTDDVQTALEGDSIGKPLAARIVRGGQSLAVSITVGERSRKED